MLCVATRLSDSSRCEHDWSLQDSTPSPDAILSYHRDLARTTSFFLCCGYLTALPCLRLLHQTKSERNMAGLSNRLSSLRHNAAARLKLCVARHILHTILTDVLLLGTELTTPAGCCSVSVWHSLPLADHGLRADLLHQISWRVSSPTDPRKGVVVFNHSTLGSSVALALPAGSGASEARGNPCPRDPASCSQWLSPHHSVSGCA